jgi:uncharacterized protein with PIN domain
VPTREPRDDVGGTPFAFYDDYRRCQDCGRVCWKGTHDERLCRLLDAALQADAP